MSEGAGVTLTLREEVAWWKLRIKNDTHQHTAIEKYDANS